MFLAVHARCPLGVLVALLAGCSSTTHSTNLDTAGFYVTYAIDAHADGPVRAVAVFRVREATGSYLELVGGDGIRVDGSRLHPIDDVTYSDDLSAPLWVGLRYEGDVGTGAEHVFTLTRDGEPPVVRGITEALPPVPTIDGRSPATARFTEQSTLVWTPLPGSTVTVVAAAADTENCSSLTVADAIPDVGAYSLDPVRLHPADRAAACTFLVTIVRTHDEPIGAPFAGGALRTIASGSMELTLR